MNQSHSEPTFRTVNPATGDVEASFPTATDQEVDDVVAASQAAFTQWRTHTVEQRSAVLHTIAKTFAERSDELARVAAVEMGKSVSEGRGEVEFCTAIFDYYANESAKLLADRPLEVCTGGDAVVQKRPLGPLLGIAPWNFPYLLVARFAAPNIAAGNTVIVKHAESCPQAALAIQAIMDDSGLPSGVYQNVFASHSQIETVIADPRVQGVSLTGSERAGSAVAAQAGKHVKKCVLELGGSDPYIVLDTPDVKAAAEAAWTTRLSVTGQACNSNKRVIVMHDLFDDFVEELVRLAAASRPKNPLAEDESGHCPMSSRRAAEVLHGQVQNAVAAGATLHVGGEISAGRDAYFSPAVLTGVTASMAAHREELFGPVVVVYAVESEADAVALANDSDFGLSGSVFSADSDRARRVAEQLQVGMANVNTVWNVGPEASFGGVKRSGFGRELGSLGLDEFVNHRVMNIAPSSGR